MTIPIADELSALTPKKLIELMKKECMKNEKKMWEMRRLNRLEKNDRAAGNK